MARKIEFGAGIAAAILALLGFVGLLFAPIDVCTVSTTSACPAQDIRTVRFIEAKQDSGIWLYVIGITLLLLIGAAGAIAEARFGWRNGKFLLLIAAVLAFMGCAIGGTGMPGLLYLPGVLALLLAGYASVQQPRRRRQDLLLAQRPLDVAMLAVVCCDQRKEVVCSE